MRAHLRLVLWCGLVLCALIGLHSVSGSQLSTPPPPWRWNQWLDEVGPAAAIVSVVRLIALACAWYLAAVTAAGIALVVAPVRASTDVWRWLPSVVGRLLTPLVSLTVMATPFVGWAQPAWAGQNLAEAFDGAQGDPGGDELDASSGAASAPVGVTMTRLRFALAPLAAPVVVDERWTVQTGDHFWSIACETLEDRWGRQPTPAEVHAYWQALVETNRHLLVAPSNTDLLYPGQVLALPDPGSADR